MIELLLPKLNLYILQICCPLNWRQLMTLTVLYSPRGRGQSPEIAGAVVAVCMNHGHHGRGCSLHPPPHSSVCSNDTQTRGELTQLFHSARQPRAEPERFAIK